MLRFVLLTICWITVKSLQFRDCGSTMGELIKVEVENCDLSAPFCILKKGTNASIEIYFTPNKITDRVTSVVHGIIRENPIPFPIPNAEACLHENSGIICPLTADVETSYRATMPVRLNYPTISLIVKWELKDEDDANIACVEIPVSIR